MFFSNKGVLGINARNLLYIRPYNQKKAIKLADNKIKTKQFLSTRGVSVPKLFGIIRTPEELEKYSIKTLPNSFVIKPNNGYGGEGIIPIIKRDKDLFITASGKKLTIEEIREHIRDILDGRYSISNVADTAFFEQYIMSDDIIGKFSYAGLPDIRIIVHNLIPVMAMLRLPTKESNGKANLHLGAVGVGIDIAKGEATNMILKNKIIHELPNGKGSIKGIKIPFWDEMLLIASNAQLITNLGYMAVDICLDKKSGPVLLEINARAGLSVQVANLAPLRKRLERIQGVKVTTPQKGIRIAKDMFGNTLEKEIKNLSGKEVIGSEEKIEILQKTHSLVLDAEINTGQNRSTLDKNIATSANLLSNDDFDEIKSTLKLKFTLKNRRIQTIVDIKDITEKKHKMIIGRRDLKNFLIDTSIEKVSKSNSSINNENNKEKEKNIEKPIITIKKNKIDYNKADREICSINKDIKLLHYINPENYKEEIEKVKKDINYNPQFTYRTVKFDELELIDRLEQIKLDNSPIGQILERKKIEIIKKIKLISQIGEKGFTEASNNLFGNPTKKEYIKCKQILLSEIEKENTTKEKTPQKKHNTKYAKDTFEKVFQKYNMPESKIILKEKMISRCTANQNGTLALRIGAKFSDNEIKSRSIHEIETHLITAHNGNMQPYKIFSIGTANYLETQEGMAIYNVSKVLNEPIEKNKSIHAQLIAIKYAQSNSFAGVVKKLISLGIKKDRAIGLTARTKRGLTDTKKRGAFTKDALYYKGYHKVKSFIENGGEMADLYIGKLNLDDLPLIKEIREIEKPKILPDFLKES